MLGQLFGRSPVSSISPQEACELAKASKAVLLDVREADEVIEGMANGAEWVPLSEIKQNTPVWTGFLARLPKDKTIITYCAAGVRAEKVASELRALGFNAENFGGYRHWVAAGLPTHIPNK